VVSVNRSRSWAWAIAGSALLALAGLAQAVPDGVRLSGLRGGELTSADLNRGGVVIVVWASWSPRCRDIVERANAVASRWGDRARVVTIDFQEDAATVEKFLGGQQLRPPVFLDRDGEFSKSMEVTSLPGLIVLRDGDAKYRGKLPSDVDSVVADALR
jgi:thiol-disulfide isomerase/thioredoxin